ncbi:MAG: NlpC/P60 family protein [Hyphomicrobiaceae bacterium]
MTHWALAYIGKPFAFDAAGPDAFDCWGLVRAVYLAQRGISLPPAGIANGDIATTMRGFRDHPERAKWISVERPQEFDAVLMAQAKHPIHVGLWVAGGLHGRVLHATERGGVVAHDVAALATQGYAVRGYFRHAG